MAFEMKVTHFVLIAIPVALLGCLVLVFFGVFSIASFDLFGWKTPEVTKKGLESLADQGAAALSGYKAAKTPSAAMDGFHKAIQARNYKAASIYTTKGYGEQLERAHSGASPIGNHCDSIRNFGTEKGLMNDVLTYALYKLDPFPRNFTVGPAPVLGADKSTATAVFVWEPVKYETKTPATLGADPRFKDMDPKMFKTLLAQPIFALAKIDLVKEGEDWKLNIPSNPAFEMDVGYFIDHHKAYAGGLNAFVTDMNRLRNASKSEFFSDVMAVLHGAK